MKEVMSLVFTEIYINGEPDYSFYRGILSSFGSHTILYILIAEMLVRLVKYIEAFNWPKNKKK